MRDDFLKKSRRERYAVRDDVERVMGVEPTYQPWEGRILPMNYICILKVYHFCLKNQEFFVFFSKKIGKAAKENTSVMLYMVIISIVPVRLQIIIIAARMWFIIITDSERVMKGGCSRKHT